MKNVLILHGTGDNPQSNWFPWLKSELEKRNWKVWVPDLPGSEEPNIHRYNEFLLAKQEWSFDQDYYIIGHSSGAVAALGLLQALPEETKINTCILIASFKDDLDWDALKNLFDPALDFPKIKPKCHRFVFIHSDDDPWCPLDGAKYLCDQLGGEFIILKGQKHFSIATAGEKYRQFPELLEMIIG